MLPIQHVWNGTYRDPTCNHRYDDYADRGNLGSLVFRESRRDFYRFGLIWMLTTSFPDLAGRSAEGYRYRFGRVALETHGDFPTDPIGR